MFPRESYFSGKRSSTESYIQYYDSSTDERAVIYAILTGSTIPGTAVTMAYRPQALPLGLNSVLRLNALPPLADSGCL